MTIFLTKVLTQLVYPLNVSVLLASLGGFLLWRRRKRLGGWCLALAIGWLWLWSAPVFSDAIRASLEQRYPAVPVEHLPEAGAIVLLGGGILPPAPPVRPDPDLRNGADRAWHAARLYHAGKAPVVIVSGGRLSWAAESEPEAIAMERFLMDLGVPQVAIVQESRSRTTRENARYTVPLLKARGIESVLLVTSALHMPRALRAFRAVGVQAEPAATDFEVVPDEPHTLLSWLPDAESLYRSSRAFKEYLGDWVYRAMHALS